MTRYGMVINLNRCVRTRTCYVACKREHRILSHPKDKEHPYEYYRLRYVEWEWGKFPTVKRAYLPMLCMHCDEPICMRFCSANAISKRTDGIVVIDKGHCNGCGACARVCPYGALYITSEGKADGCNFCADRLDAGLTPRCAEECPSKAILFGNLDDLRSEVHEYVTSGRAKPLLLNGVKDTKVYYLRSKNEPELNRLSTNEGFLSALDKRKSDLPSIKGTF